MESAAAIEFSPIAAVPSVSRNFLVVSLHDIAPSTQAIAEKMLGELSGLGVRSSSLLVVPDYHHQGPATEDRQFVAWLRNLEATGHEIVLHGYFHERPRKTNETTRDKFLTRFYTQDEAEFYDLNYAEALRRITMARDQFRASGFKPRGFVAPGWLLSPEARKAACDAEMEYTTELRSVSDLRSGEKFATRSIVYSVRSHWRRVVSRRWNATLFRLLRGNPLLRISLHPPDYSHPTIWRQIMELVEGAADSRNVTTYQDWIAEQRLRRGT